MSRCTEPASILQNEAIARVGRAMHWLARQRDGTGLWSSFDSSQGRSDVWVSAFVASEVEDILGATLAGTVASLKSAQAPDGGWSYKRGFPTDADSTATVLRFLIRADSAFLAQANSKAAVKCLLGHLDDWSTGFATYLPNRLSAVLPSDVTTSGWTKPHVDVTANVLYGLLAAGAPLDETQIDILVSALLSNGGTSGQWEAYWWATDVYSTFRLCELQHCICHRKLQRTLEYGAHAILLEQCDDGCWRSDFSAERCVFTTALALRVISPFSKYRLSTGKAVRSLLDLQLDDGSWASCPILVLPPPNCSSRHVQVDWRIDMPGFPNVLSDSTRVLVTAVVARSLTECTRYL